MCFSTVSVLVDANEVLYLINSINRCWSVQFLCRKLHAFLFYYYVYLTKLLDKNYTQSCVAARNCQAQIFNIDYESDINVYSLSTVATMYQLSIGKHGVIDQKDNVDGFQSTATVWTRT